MNQFPLDPQHLTAILKPIFPTTPTCVERVPEGISTYVYRVSFPHETFYLRILPEEDASFAPEVAVHTQLRQNQVKVPEIIHFEHYNSLLQRSIMVTTEVKGQPVSNSYSLPAKVIEEILREAGRDLARINSLRVEGFGWVKRDLAAIGPLHAQWSAHRTFALEFWQSDIAHLRATVLQSSEVLALDRILTRYAAWLDADRAYLAHGDFDATHIYQQGGRYSGIIDFGEIRGADRCYDLGHFHIRDGERLPMLLEPFLLHGYGEAVVLPPTHEQHICFIGLLINVRALARSLQKRPPDQYTDHQLKVLRKDLTFLLR